MKTHFFGEWVFFDDEEEKEDAYKYLALWKKFILKRLPDMEQIGYDQIVIKAGFPSNTLGIKIEMKGKVPENIISGIAFHENKSP